MNSRNSLPVALAVCLCLAVPASAQYFGRNKVQFKRLDFEVLKTEHFDIAPSRGSSARAPAASPKDSAAAS
jgi:hypothetical protein